MTPLHERPRVRKLRSKLARLLDPQASAAAPSPGAAITPGAPSRFHRDFGPGGFADEEQSIARLLVARLGEGERSAIEARIAAEPELSPTFQAADPETRLHLILHYGAWLGHPAVTDGLGLGRQEIPAEIHAMARGPLAAAGGIYEADMVAGALQSAGGSIAEVRSALDFGCSSGRVLRPFQAAFPEIDWRGCDPNTGAIEWARENLPGITFFESGATPPLALADDSLDLVYAISIWSHFVPGLGLDWFEEMRRILRPGGYLIFTTHGETTVAYDAARLTRSPAQCDEILGALYRQGAWYAPEFGESGDWGIVDEGWGNAFLSAEFLLTYLCPRWRVLEFAPGRNQSNQDVYVLQRP